MNSGFRICAFFFARRVLTVIGPSSPRTQTALISMYLGHTFQEVGSDRAQRESPQLAPSLSNLDHQGAKVFCSPVCLRGRKHGDRNDAVGGHAAQVVLMDDDGWIEGCRREGSAARMVWALRIQGEISSLDGHLVARDDVKHDAWAANISGIGVTEGKIMQMCLRRRLKRVYDMAWCLGPKLKAGHRSRCKGRV